MSFSKKKTGIISQANGNKNIEKIEASNAKDNTKYLFPNNKISSPIIHKYNMVKSYILAIRKLWV